MSEKRIAAYAQEGIVDPDDRSLHMVALVTEDEAGYSATTYVGTLDYCKAVADSINERSGLSEDDVLKIVASSFRAQNVQRHGVL